MIENNIVSAWGIHHQQSQVDPRVEGQDQSAGVGAGETTGGSDSSDRPPGAEFSIYMEPLEPHHE